MGQYETKPLIDYTGLIAYPENEEDERIFREMDHRDMTTEQISRIDPCAPWQLRGAARE